jgi:dihydrodipicolinate synthase/N-acetylneuraminate lyase
MPLVSAGDIRGVWATVLLEISPSGDILYDAIGRQIAALARAGVDGVYCNGTATEFHCQTEDQFYRVASATVSAAREAGLPVQVGASHPLALGGLGRLRIAAALAPDAIQVTLPDWTPINLSTAIRFLTTCAEEAAGIPLVLYNPPHAKTVLSPDHLQTVSAEIPSLIGLKCAGGDRAWYAAMAPVLDRLSVFIPGHHYASGVAQGAQGSYSNMACLSPAGAVRWAQQVTEDAIAACDVEKRIGTFMQEAIQPLLTAGFPGYACDKAMAAAGGWAGLSSRLLWPYEGVPDSAIERIAQAASRHLPEFLDQPEASR